MRRNHHCNARRVAMLAIVVLPTLWAGLLLARSTGRFGEALTADGCQCHSATPNANGPVTVNIVGPQSVTPGSTNSYTVFVTGGPSGTLGGFNLKAQDGTLIAVDADVQVGGTPVGTEVTHTNGDNRVWHFDWTAPATEGTVEFYAIAQSTDGSGTGGDSWNFYGGSVGAPFPIDVAAPAGVGDPGPAVLSLSPAYPNPFASSARIRFSLARSGPARLDVFDLSGRRIATLAAGEFAAGPHEVAWNGLTSRGEWTDAGVYLVRLAAGGRVLTTRVVRISR